MSFFTFLLKKTSKRWMNIIPIFLVTLFIVFIYYGNHSGAFYLANTTNYESQLKGWEADVDHFTEELETCEPDTEKYNIVKENLDIAKEGALLSESIVRSFKNENWKEYYESSNKFTDMTLKAWAESEGTNTEDYRAVEFNKKYKEYMIHHNLSFDERFRPIQGISFMASVLNQYMPIVIAILIAFITSNMYCASFVDKMDIHDTIPMSKLKKQGSKLLLGLFFGVILLLLFSIIAILCGGIGNSFGSFQSPIVTYTLQGADQYISFSSILLRLLILIVLSILFIVNMVSIIANITKRNLTCFLAAAGIMLGLMWITTNIVPLHSYVHLFPTTYLNWMKVISGELMNTVGNTNVSFMNGVIVLVIANVVLFLIYFICKRYFFKEVKLRG